MEEVRNGLRKLSGSGVRTLIIAAGIIAFIISPAFAELGYTSVSGSHAQILSEIYGGYFMQIGTVDYGKVGVRAWRVYDSDGSGIRLDLLSGSPDDVDQVWTDGTSSVTTEVKYKSGSGSQSFGWNGSGGLGTDTYEQLLTEESSGPSASIDVTGDFLWGYKPSGEEWWSLQSENDFDHMVTYQITGLPNRTGESVWLVFMEDAPLDISDKDYNDFVVEISAIENPEPATAFLLISGIALVLRKRKR